MFDGKTNPRARINAIAARFLGCALCTASHEPSRHRSSLTISFVVLLDRTSQVFRMGNKSVYVAFTVTVGNNSLQSDARLRRTIKRRTIQRRSFLLFSLFCFLEILSSLSRFSSLLSSLPYSSARTYFKSFSRKRFSTPACH